VNWPLLCNSLLLASLTAGTTLLLGAAAALWLLGLPGRGQRAFLLGAVVALALPPFVVANAWLRWLGPTGVWRDWLPWNLYSLGGAVWVLSLMFWLLWGAWQRVQGSQLECEPSLTGLRLVRWLLWPAARRAAALAALLVFVLALNNFAVPSLLQVRVFPIEVWLQFNTTLDSLGALGASWPLLLAPLLVFAVWRYRAVPWPRSESQSDPALFRRQVGAACFRLCGAVAIGLGLLAVVVPLAELAARRQSWQALPAELRASQSAWWHSAILALTGASSAVAVGLLTARRPRWPVLWFGFFLPGVLVALALTWLFDRPWTAWFYRSTAIVVMALTLRYAAPAAHSAREGILSLDRELVDAARLEGASTVAWFRDVFWPQAGLFLLAAWYVTFLLCLWDTETLLLLVPPGGETLALRIYNFLHFGRSAQVNALCLILLALASLPLVLAWAGHESWRWIRKLLGQPSRAWTMLLLACGSVVTGCSRASPDEVRVQSQRFQRVRLLGTRGAGLGQFNKPRSVAVDAQDNLYVVDMTGRVQKFSPAGEYLAYWQMPQTDLGKPKGMCRDERGQIVVLEPHYSRVNHFTPAGKLTEQWGQHGTNAGALAFPRAVAATAQGQVYVSEYGLLDRVQRFSASPRKLEMVLGEGGRGPGQFSRAEGLDTDRAGRLYVADSCNHRIQIFSPTGQWLASYGRAGAGPGELSYPYDIRVDADGYQYVCEFGNSRIQVFDPQNRPVEILGGPGAAPGQFSNPWSLALDSRGNLYVADSMNHRVQRFVR
jgi:ABC-type Fe3+ transport system permease subunit/sugar lactone lactonase YvrE